MKHIFRLMILLSAIFLFLACKQLKELLGITDAIEQTIQVLEQASTDIGYESSQWRSILQQAIDELPSRLSDEIRSDVDSVLQRGIAATGVEARCSVDFLGSRVKESLDALIARLQGKKPPPLLPVVCKTEPSSLNMGDRPDVITFYGYNFDANDVGFIFRYNSGDKPIRDWAINTHYEATLDVSLRSGINEVVCDVAGERKLVMRCGNTDISQVLIIRKECPERPPAEPAKPRRLLTRVIEKKPGTITWKPGYIVIVGGPCTPGYQRADCQAIKGSEGTSLCSTQWFTPITTDCTCKLIVNGNYNSGVDCTVAVYEEGIPPERPPAPDCGCT